MIIQTQNTNNSKLKGVYRLTPATNQDSEAYRVEIVATGALFGYYVPAHYNYMFGRYIQACGHLNVEVVEVSHD